VKGQRVRELLALAFSEHLTTNCAYTGYAFGYRRVVALFAIHGFRHITRPVELNPWLEGIGRGTFPNVVAKIERAISFARRPSDLNRRGGRQSAGRSIGVPGNVRSTPDDVIQSMARGAVVCRSARALEELPANCVDLVLTDPPYFDNVSYSELSDFYLAWHQVLGTAPAPYQDPDLAAPLGESLATRDRSAEAIQRYRQELQTIIAECRRVLRPDGICVFTYHHESPKAWEAVGAALAASGLYVTAVIPMRGEGQGGLHSFEGTIKWDAVLVCRPRRRARVRMGTLVVREAALERVSKLLARYRKQLRRDTRIGFRAPDIVNLRRAILVAVAEPSDSVKEPSILLSEALRQKSVPRRS
jgi:hypothetical protein